MRTRVTTLAVLCACSVFAVTPASALADLWVAANGTDTGYCSQANPCATLSRAVSLAIPNDTIFVGPGIFYDHVIIDPSVSGLVVQGSGTLVTAIIGGSQPGSVLTIQDGATATIDDLSISGGSSDTGGGVANHGVLTMARDEVAANVASGPGGGIDSSKSGSGPNSLTLLDSVVSANRGETGGGGVYIEEDGTLERDLISGNHLTGGIINSYDGGGGVWGDYSTLSDSTVVDNAENDSRGVPIGLGGGAYMVDSKLNSDTIADNDAAQYGGVFGGRDIMSGTVLAGNTHGSCYPSLEGATVGGGYNLSSDTACQLQGTGDISGQDPMLQPLADNGGPTDTMSISTSSPAYDANANCSGTDQRGVSYLQRGASRCDMGAFQVEAPSTYVANPSAGSVTAYASGASGDASPVLALKGAAAGLSQPTGVLADADGNVFVTNAGNNSITEYAPEVTGNVAPVATIAGSKTRLNKPQDVALGDNGNLFVTNLAGSVTEYASGARGNVAPIADIVGSLSRLSKPRGLVFDPSGNLRVSNGNGTVNTYSASANGNVAPLSRLVHGNANGLSINLQGLNFDGAGNLVLADAGAGRVASFGGGASGVANPLSTLTGNPSLQVPTGLDLDAFGNVFVADNAANSVDEFAAGSSGSARPSAVISGPGTGLASPAFLSELPPPPVPGLHASTSKRRSRNSLLRDGIRLTLTAWGKKAFRAQPVTIGVLARVRGRTFATAKTLALHPGKTKLQLVLSKHAPKLLRRHHKTKIKLTITIRGGFGARRHHLTITSTG